MPRWAAPRPHRVGGPNIHEDADVRGTAEGTMARKGFPQVEQEYIDHAREKTLAALTDTDTPQRLRRCYCVDADYAGSSFTKITPNTSDAITTADLVATTMLSASIPAHSVRLVLDDKGTRKAVRRLLDELPDCRIEDTKAKHFRPMSDFYEFMKEILGQAGAAPPRTPGRRPAS